MRVGSGMLGVRMRVGSGMLGTLGKLGCLLTVLVRRFVLLDALYDTVGVIIFVIGSIITLVGVSIIGFSIRIGGSMGRMIGGAGMRSSLIRTGL